MPDTYFFYVTIKYNYNAENYSKNKYQKVLKSIEKKAPNLNTKIKMSYVSYVILSPLI